MRIGLQIPPAGIGNPTEFAVEAEEMGYDSLWAAELWGSSAVVQLADIAAATDDIGLGTAILNVFSRSPAVLAMASATLDRVSDGRFHLGVGTSTRKAVEDLHGESFETPVRHAHETIELAKKFLGDEGRVEYDGEVHHPSTTPRSAPPTAASSPGSVTDGSRTTSRSRTSTRRSTTSPSTPMRRVATLTTSPSRPTSPRR